MTGIAVRLLTTLHKLNIMVSLFQKCRVFFRVTFKKGKFPGCSPRQAPHLCLFNLKASLAILICFKMFAT